MFIKGYLCIKFKSTLLSHRNISSERGHRQRFIIPTIFCMWRKGVELNVDFDFDFPLCIMLTRVFSVWKTPFFSHRRCERWMHIERPHNKWVLWLRIYWHLMGTRYFQSQKRQAKGSLRFTFVGVFFNTCMLQIQYPAISMRINCYAERCWKKFTY